MPALHINQLPPELLAHILRGCDCRAHNNYRMLQLACVCRHWHDVLFGHPEFWTVLRCDILTKFQNEQDHEVHKLVAHLQRWFERAGNLPLSLTLWFRYPAGKIALLYDYLIGNSQWRHLNFTLDSVGDSNWRWFEGLIATAQGRGQACWPDLVSLEVDAPARYTTGRFALALEDVAPSIQRVVVSIEELQFSISSVFERFHWTHITHFEFSGTVAEASLAFYLDLLSWAPNLVSLKALDWPSDLTVPAPDPSPIMGSVPTRKSLRHLALHHSPSCVQLFAAVRLPSLRTLEFHRPSQFPPPFEIPGLPGVICMLLSTSDCKIRDLRLKWTPLSDEELVNTLTVLGPTLEKIELDEAAAIHPDVPDSFFRLLQEGSRPSWREMVPNLNRFSYNEGYRCSVVEVRDDGFEAFRDAPLEWWRSTAAGGGA